MKSKQEYSEAYYQEFLRYGVHKRGTEFTTMVRPYDKSYQFEGRFYARPEHAPVGWVGDNRRDWVGLEDALDHIFRSADAGYVMVGSDIGGYLDRDDIDLSIQVPFDQLNFVRWIAMGAMTPFMQLHGRANLEPWSIADKPDETVDIYRYWATLHHELVPFFYSLAQEAYAGGANIIRPEGVLADWAGDYRFHVGEAFFVAPILDETGVRDVELPAGAQYYDWFKPGDPALAGGQTLTAYDATDTTTTTIPLFVREGAIIPAHVDTDLTGLGNAASAGHLTVAVYPAASASSFTLHDDDEATTTIDAQTGSMSLSRALKPVVLKVRVDAAPAAEAAGDEAPADEAVAEEAPADEAPAEDAAADEGKNDES